jgi:hypothetical protein
VGGGVSTDESVRLKAGLCEAIVDDLRAVLRLAQGRNEEPSAAIFDSRTLHSSPRCVGIALATVEPARRKESKVHLAVDTLGHLLALQITPTNEQDRAQVGQLAAAVQGVTGHSVELAIVDQGYTSDEPAQAAQEQGMRHSLASYGSRSSDALPLSVSKGTD